MLPAQSVPSYPNLFQPWQAPNPLPSSGRQQPTGFIELPTVSNYLQLRDHAAFHAIKTQFLHDVRELKRLAHAYVNQQYDGAIDTFAAKLERPGDDLLGNLLPIYRETRYQIHLLVGMLTRQQNPDTGIKDCVALALHECLDGIDLCLAGIHSRFSRSFQNITAMSQNDMTGRIYRLRIIILREFIEAFLWESQRNETVRVAPGMEVHWFNALHNLYCGNLGLEPIDDPQAITNLPDKILSDFLQGASISASACVILHRLTDIFCYQIQASLAAVGCSHWLTEPTHSSENTAIGINALISNVFNPINSLMGTVTSNSISLTTVMDLCSNESFHLKRHREKMLAWFTGHFYSTSATVFSQVHGRGYTNTYIGTINELFYWVFDHASPLYPGQTCCFDTDQHTTLRLAHLFSIDFSSWSASTSHALLTQALGQTDEPGEIAEFFLNPIVIAQFHILPRAVYQALSNQLSNLLLQRTSDFKKLLCQNVCDHFVRSTKVVSGDLLDWLINTPLLEPVLLGLSQHGIDISQVTKRLRTWHISDWPQHRVRELLQQKDCQRLFRQAFRLHQLEVLASVLLTGHCDRLVYSSRDSIDGHYYFQKLDNSLLNLFACNNNLICLKYLLVLAREESATARRHDHQTMAAIVNQRCKNGFTPLLSAAMHGHTDCLQELLFVPGIEVNATNDSGFTPLHLAARHGNLACVQALLQTRGIAVNRKTPKGMTPLDTAVVFGHLDVVRELLALTSHGVKVSCNHLKTPLQYAALTGNTGILQVLLARADFDVNNKGLFGWTALGLAANAGHQQFVRALLQVPGILVNEPNNDGWTPLNCAAQKGHYEVLKDLLPVPGIDVNAESNDGWTPLNSSAMKGFVNCVQALLDVPGILVNEANSAGCSALSSAVQGGHLDCVRQLLMAEGIDVNQACHTGLTPLSHAAQSGYLAIVKAILAMPNVLVNVRKNGFTALHYAANQGYVGIVRALLQMPGVLINVHSGSITGVTPLLSASEKGYWQCVEELLSASGIDVNEPDSSGWTPLNAGTRHGRLLCIQQLLRMPGIDVNKPNDHGWAPLHQAIRWGHQKCAQVLLQAEGIQVNSLTQDGAFPLGIAARLGDLQSLQTLLAMPDIEINKVGMYNATALHIAASYGHVGCVRALLQAKCIDLYHRDHFQLRPLDTAMRFSFTKCAQLLLHAMTSKKPVDDACPPSAKIPRLDHPAIADRQYAIGTTNGQPGQALAKP